MAGGDAREGGAPLLDDRENARMLVRSIRDHALCMLDAEGIVRAWTPGAQAIYAYATSEIVGRHVSILSADEAREEVGRDLGAAATSGAVRVERWRVRRDGARIWADIGISAIRDDEGRLVGFADVATDATAKRAAQERLRESEERLHLTIQTVKDYAIFALDIDGRVTSWNEGARRIKGWERDEILGRHMSTFYPPEDIAVGKPAWMLRRAVEDGRVEDEGWRVRKDGSRFWADVVITAMRDATGLLRGFTKVTRDLTLKRRAEEELRASEVRATLFIESVQDYALFMLDERGHVATWNAGAQRIKGYRPDEIVGKHFSIFYPPEEVASGKCERELETAVREGRLEDEGWRVRKSGERFWANVVIVPVRDRSGRLVGYGKVTRDLTERRELEREQIRLAQAQEAVRLRDEFLSIASHELKTPLTVLQLQLEALGERLEALDGPTRKKVERAGQSAERLVELVDALLDVSRISSGRFDLHPERFDLAELVAEVADRLRDAAARAGCEIVVSAQPAVTGVWDRVRLEQVLVNLLSNAIKYGAGAPIRVSIARRDGSADIEVCDGGPGIPESAVDRIFERFERAASMRHYGGLGLGLYVTREIAQAHGGSVAARNVPGGGACFTVSLPLEPVASARAPAEIS
jgi:PAS domain S-box-containing protein